MAKKQKTTNEPETVNVATEPTPEPKKRGRKAKVIEPEAVGDAGPTTEAIEPAAAPEPAPAPKKRKGKSSDTTGNDAPATPVIETQAPTAAKAKRKGKRTVEGSTLADAFAGYLRGLEDAGKSEGTIFSYRLELVMAGAELGTDTKVADLTPERVLLFFTSDRVTKTRSGRPKSPLSIDKTRRVVRQALAWAEGAGMVAKAPVPELVANE